jgi:thiamine biosynthesis lipoprotein
MSYAGRLNTFMLACMILISGGCTKEPQEHNHTILSFGTIIEVTIYGTDKQTAEDSFAILEQDFSFMQEVWNPWGHGPLYRINEYIPTMEWFSPGTSTPDLIKKGIELEAASKHLFNPAIGKLIKLWGFHEEFRTIEEPPSKEEIEKVLATKPSLEDLDFKGITMRSNNPDVILDFGAMAKGYGIDLALQHLQDLGIKNAIINAGGDLRAIGTHGDRPWNIGIRHPRADKIMAAVQIQDGESVFTSGDYERYFEHEGVRYHHIIDPRTGYPARETTSVTVIHRDAATADAAATAMFVAGPNHWYEIARSMGIKYVMLIDIDGVVHMNPAMEARIHFEQKPGKVVLSKPL